MISERELTIGCRPYGWRLLCVTSALVHVPVLEFKEVTSDDKLGQ
jgi:hypothetical protein